jgi:hypothetical protein
MAMIIFALGGCVMGALFGIPAGYVLRRVPQQWRSWFHLGLVAASAFPYFLHYRYSLAYLARSGVESYSGLEQYAAYFPLAVLALTLGALFIARVRAVAAALFPIVLGGAYWYLLVPLIYRGTPNSFVGLDNVPFVWLFAYSVSAFVFLLVVALLAFRPRAHIQMKP